MEIKIILGSILPLLIIIAYTTLLERKVMGYMQRRVGPQLVGKYGILQPLADGLKLFLKENIIPSKSNSLLYFIAPMISLILSLIIWGIIPIYKTHIISDLSLSILIILAISSLNVYGIILSGWSSNSKYAFLGSLRSTAQMISYEISIGIILLSILSFIKSYNLHNIVLYQKNIWMIIPGLPLFLLFIISALAETNRPPFDLPEAEAELVSGYNVEYSGMGFAYFFIAEYGNIILMATLISLIFLGGWLIIPLSMKVILILFIFIWVRATFPRYRFDQLMYLGWKCLLPISIGLLIFYSSFNFFI